MNLRARATKAIFPNGKPWRKGADVTKWKVGDHAIITGDTHGIGHEFSVDDEVRLFSYDDSDDTWRCEYLDGHDYWWVAPDDLKPVEPPLSDKEVKAALKSIQQSARNVRKRPHS